MKTANEQLIEQISARQGLSGRGAKSNASSTRSSVTGGAFGRGDAATMRGDNGQMLDLFILDVDALDDENTYLGDEAIEDVL